MATEKNVGKIVEIKGVVIDAVFHGELPASTTRCASRSPSRTAGPRST